MQTEKPEIKLCECGAQLIELHFGDCENAPETHYVCPKNHEPPTSGTVVATFSKEQDKFICSDLLCNECEPRIEDWEKQWDSRVAQVQRQNPEPGEDGDICEFGFKSCTAEDDAVPAIYTVVDWHNIKKFIKTLLQKERRETVVNMIGLIEKKRSEWTIHTDNPHEAAVDDAINVLKEFMNNL